MYLLKFLYVSLFAVVMSFSAQALEFDYSSTTFAKFVGQDETGEKYSFEMSVGEDPTGDKEYFQITETMDGQKYLRLMSKTKMQDIQKQTIRLTEAKACIAASGVPGVFKTRDQTLPTCTFKQVVDEREVSLEWGDVPFGIVRSSGPSGSWEVTEWSW